MCADSPLREAAAVVLASFHTPSCSRWREVDSHFIGFPLHPAGRPSAERGQHLFQVQTPMLFLQGTRDHLADLQLVRSLAAQLGARVTLNLFQNADHFVSCARTYGTQGFGSPSRNVGCVGGMD
ncbi:MAG: alpha/beta family hydrolase [Gammaproteobacteria bacterium]